MSNILLIKLTLLINSRLLTANTNLENTLFAEPVSVSVGVKRKRGNSGESFNHSLGLGVSFAFDVVYRQPAIANAAPEIADVQVARQRLEIELNSILATSLQDLESKRQQLLLKKEHIDTTQHLKLQKRAFELGELELVAFLK